MNVAIGKPMTLDVFLKWEARQERKWEFDGRQPVAMAGGTRAHDTIRWNIGLAISPRLRGGPCRVQGPDLKVSVNGRVRYPEAFVVCSKAPPDATVVTDPVVIFEVLSPGTYETDHVEKNLDYAATPSIRRHVMLEQGQAVAAVFHRADGEWVGLVQADGVVDMPEVGLSVPLAAFYADVDFPSPDPNPAEA